MADVGAVTPPRSVRLPGQPLQVVIVNDDHTFELNEEDLTKVLLDPRVKDNKVVVLSVAGAFRKGKSFLLNFCLRYLQAEGSVDWLGDDTTPLEGFQWRGGAERDTTGILMWSEPFIVRMTNGDQVAVLLMDTQGAFDSKSTVKDCATVFALSTLLSSVQVFNITLNIQEDDLQHLQLFTEYGRLAMEDNGAKPFQSSGNDVTRVEVHASCYVMLANHIACDQDNLSAFGVMSVGVVNLTFLVRDWQYPYEFSYGAQGGTDLLNKRLQVAESQHSELQQLRQHIRSCFSNISGFLMPHPGLKVATNPHFDGRLSDITADFKAHVRELIPLLLCRQNLIVKQIHGSPITGRELIEYFKAYLKLYQGDILPEPKSMLQATAEANNLSAVAVAQDFYCSEMEKVCGGDLPYISPDFLLLQHTRCSEAALRRFQSVRKMGGEQFSQPYIDQLQCTISDHYASVMKQNEAKNVFSAARTPAVICACAAAFYILSGVLGTLGLMSLANIANIVMLAFVVMLCVWVYTRYTGEHREFGQIVDHIAEVLWDEIIGPIWLRLMRDGATHVVTQQVSLHSNNNKKRQ